MFKFFGELFIIAFCCSQINNIKTNFYYLYKFKSTPHIPISHIPISHIPISHIPTYPIPTYPIPTYPKRSL